MSTLFSRFTAWAHRTLPTREHLEEYRLVRPLAQRHELWRFTRRSVPRGVGIGLLIGILAMIPGVQMVGAALMCMLVRGNIPIAVVMTFLSNPATTPLILAASIYIGNRFGFNADLTTFQALIQSGAGFDRWVAWLLSDAAPSMLFGLLVISIVTALIGYVIAALLWRCWIGHKRKTRERARELQG
jgi:uncharacterized protein